MLQRIQTLYLIGSVILIALVINLPLITLSDTSGTLYTLTSTGLFQADGVKLMSGIYMAVLFAGLGMLVLVSIFLFRKRTLQMRITIFSLLIYVGSYGLIFYYYQFAVSAMGLSLLTMHIPLSFPLIGAVMQFLAFNGISKDDRLVKSYDRLR